MKYTFSYLLVLPALIISSSLLAMNDSQKKITLPAKMQACVAAAAPLLVCPPLIVPIAALIGAIPPDITALTVRASVTTLAALPLNAAITAVGHHYIAPHNEHLNTLSKFLASFSISNETSNYLTRQEIIPPAPTASTISEALYHTAVSMLVSTATQQIAYPRYTTIDPTVKTYPIKKAQLNEALARLTATGNFALKWKPAVAHNISVRTAKEESSTALIVNSGPIISCRMSLDDGAIMVSEAVLIPGNSNNIHALVSKYKATQPDAFHHLPCGLHGFSSTFKKCYQEVLNNHITVTGIPLKTIMPPEESAKTIQ